MGDFNTSPGIILSNISESDNCTCEELIAAYLSACKAFKAAPVDFLLEQLRGIDLSICNERYSRLCLRGIRLSRFQVETLEEVFRRVQFRKVDLEDAFLDDASATALFDMMLHYETCVDLAISLNLERPGPSVAWHRCITYLRKSSELQSFKLCHTPLSVHNLSGLTLSGTSVQKITLRDCSVNGSVLSELVRWLRHLMIFTAASYGDGYRPASSSSSSSSSSCSSSSRAATTPNGRCPRLSYRGPQVLGPWGLRLHLPENRLSASDVHSLMPLIRHQLVLLPEVPTPSTDSERTSDSGRCSEESNTRSFDSALKPLGGSGYLMELNLAQNNLRDEGVQSICSGLLRAFQMQHHRLDVAIKAIAEVTSCFTKPLSHPPLSQLPPAYALPRAQGLQRLYLSENNLGVAACRYLGSVLRHSTEHLAPLLGGLTLLDLSNNPGIGDDGVEELCEGLVRNTTIRELLLRNVKMGFGGVFALSGCLGETKSLTSLDIRQNNIDISGIMALAKSMQINRTLTTLLLDASISKPPATEAPVGLAQQFRQELDDCLRRNRRDAYSKIAVQEGKSVAELHPQTPLPTIATTTALPNGDASPVEAIEEEEEEVQSQSGDMEIRQILLDPPKHQNADSTADQLDTAVNYTPPIELCDSPYVRPASQQKEAQLEETVNDCLNNQEEDNSLHDGEVPTNGCVEFSPSRVTGSTPIEKKRKLTSFNDPEDTYVGDRELLSRTASEDAPDPMKAYQAVNSEVETAVMGIVEAPTCDSEDTYIGDSSLLSRTPSDPTEHAPDPTDLGGSANRQAGATGLADVAPPVPEAVAAIADKQSEAAELSDAPQPSIQNPETQESRNEKIYDFDEFPSAESKTFGIPAPNLNKLSDSLSAVFEFPLSSWSESVAQEPSHGSLSYSMNRSAEVELADDAPPQVQPSSSLLGSTETNAAVVQHTTELMCPIQEVTSQTPNPTEFQTPTIKASNSVLPCHGHKRSAFAEAREIPITDAADTNTNAIVRLRPVTPFSFVEIKQMPLKNFTDARKYVVGAPSTISFTSAESRRILAPDTDDTTVVAEKQNPSHCVTSFDVGKETSESNGAGFAVFHPSQESSECGVKVPSTEVEKTSDNFAPDAKSDDSWSTSQLPEPRELTAASDAQEPSAFADADDRSCTQASPQAAEGGGALGIPSFDADDSSIVTEMGEILQRYFEDSNTEAVLGFSETQETEPRVTSFKVNTFTEAGEPIVLGDRATTEDNAYTGPGTSNPSQKQESPLRLSSLEKEEPSNLVEPREMLDIDIIGATNDAAESSSLHLAADASEFPEYTSYVKVVETVLSNCAPGPSYRNYLTIFQEDSPEVAAVSSSETDIAWALESLPELRFVSPSPPLTSFENIAKSLSASPISSENLPSAAPSSPSNCSPTSSSDIMPQSTEESLADSSRVVESEISTASTQDTWSSPFSTNKSASDDRCFTTTLDTTQQGKYSSSPHTSSKYENSSSLPELQPTCTEDPSPPEAASCSPENSPPRLQCQETEDVSNTSSQFVAGVVGQVADAMNTLTSSSFTSAMGQSVSTAKDTPENQGASYVPPKPIHASSSGVRSFAMEEGERSSRLHAFPQSNNYEDLPVSSNNVTEDASPTEATPTESTAIQFPERYSSENQMSSDSLVHKSMLDPSVEIVSFKAAQEIIYVSSRTETSIETSVIVIESSPEKSSSNSIEDTQCEGIASSSHLDDSSSFLEGTEGWNANVDDLCEEFMGSRAFFGARLNDTSLGDSSLVIEASTRDSFSSGSIASPETSKDPNPTAATASAMTNIDSEDARSSHFEDGVSKSTNSGSLPIVDPVTTSGFQSMHTHPSKSSIQLSGDAFQPAVQESKSNSFPAEQTSKEEYLSSPESSNYSGINTSPEKQTDKSEKDHSHFPAESDDSKIDEPKSHQTKHHTSRPFYDLPLSVSEGEPNRLSEGADVRNSVPEVENGALKSVVLSCTEHSENQVARLHNALELSVEMPQYPNPISSDLGSTSGSRPSEPSESVIDRVTRPQSSGITSDMSNESNIYQKCRLDAAIVVSIPNQLDGAGLDEAHDATNTSPVSCDIEGNPSNHTTASPIMDDQEMVNLVQTSPDQLLQVPSESETNQAPRVANPWMDAEDHRPGTSPEMDASAEADGKNWAHWD